MSIKDLVIVVTGAGSGLGRALAVGLSKAGAQVVGVGRRSAPLADTAGFAAVGRFVAVELDVSDPTATLAAFDRIVQAHGAIDVLFNNAAVYPKIGFLEQSAEDWNQAVLINIAGPANCCRAVLPHMKARGRGRIINIGSFADRNPIPLSSAYSVSKGGLHALHKAIAADLMMSCPQIELIEWIPGHLNTEMSANTGMPPENCVPWAISLIEMPSNGKNGRTFVENREQLPIQSLRQKFFIRLKSLINKSSSA